MAEDFPLMKEMPTDDVLPNVFEEPNCRVAQPAIADDVVILANTKTCDFQVKDVSMPTKPTKMRLFHTKPTCLTTYKNYGKRAVES